MHWSESYAKEVLEKIHPRKKVTIGSGISLSAPVHTGHSREFLTAALVGHAIQNLGGEIRFIAFADDTDPLKKVYSFLPKEYSRWVGCSLCKIPDPFGCHKSYSEHFLSEFITGINLIGLNPEIIRVSKLYESHGLSGHIIKTLHERHEINNVIDKVTGRNGKPKHFFSPECPQCLSIRKTIITKVNQRKILFHCNTCKEDYSYIIGSNEKGKLSWRCDWPSRWAKIGIDIEPVAQDHYSAGGSYHSAKILARKVYGTNAPVPIPYAWIRSATSGDMHSSSNNTVSLLDLGKTYPPEIIWWMAARHKPKSLITFDPTMSLVNESRLLRNNLNAKGHHLDSAEVVQQICGIRQWLQDFPFNHVVLAAQLSNFNTERTLNILQRSDVYSKIDTPILPKDLQMIRYWIEKFGEKYKVKIRNSNESIHNTKHEMISALRSLSETFNHISWKGEIIHDAIYKTAKIKQISTKELFLELYRRTIGQSSGPKLGWLFETLGREKVLELLS